MTLSIAYSELGSRNGGSPLFTVRKKGSGGTRKLKVAWGDLSSAWQQILGYSKVVRSTSTPTLRREIPEYHPLFSTFVATEVQLEKGVKYTGTLENANGRYNGYQDAFLSVEYSEVDYVILTDDQIDAGNLSEVSRYVSYREETTADYLSIPQGGVYWASNAPTTPKVIAGTIVPFSTGRIECYKELHYTWHEVPYDGIPNTTIAATVGRVNKTAFGIYPPGTLLCEAPRVDLYVQANQQFGWEIEYIFRYKSTLWNNIFCNNPGGTSGYYQVNRTSTGTYYPPGAIPAGQCIYDEVDFNLLFNVT